MEAIPVISSRVEEMKPSEMRAGIRGEYSYHWPRRLERISRRPLVSRVRYWAGMGEGGARKGW